MIHHFKDAYPIIDETAFIANNATVIGDVVIGESSSVWFGVVIRGDIAPTRIGNRVNIQDLSMIHQSRGMPVIIEDDVTIGHQVMIHSAKINKGALIGMGSIILDGAEIGEEAFIGAGSLVPPGKKIPPRTLALGRPAKVVRELTEEDFAYMKKLTNGYVDNGEFYKGYEELNEDWIDYSKPIK